LSNGKLKCDVSGPSAGEWSRLEREEKKLNEDWSSTQSEIMSLQQRLLEMQSKLMRLDKQREMFRSRAAEMFRRGLKSLEELDALEEEERLASSTPAPEPSSFGDESLFLDPSLDPVLSAARADFDPSDPFWSSLVSETSGGTPRAIPGS
jgi:hypothetical protein